jgi:uncharacterized membrane protein YhaH (DUF805 family)
MNYYFSNFRKYAVFKGRSSRSEYWSFVLIHILVSTIFAWIFGLSGPSTGMLLYSVYSVITLIPFLAVSVRRMHDVGKSGWFLLIPIYDLILLLTEGDVGTNKYGPSAEVLVIGIK